jgi:hypothetical protein
MELLPTHQSLAGEREYAATLLQQVGERTGVLLGFLPRTQDLELLVYLVVVFANLIVAANLKEYDIGFNSHALELHQL